MGKEIISLNLAELNSKIADVKNIKATIENDIVVKNLPFGANASASESKGDAVNKIKELNAELDSIIEKIAMLNEKTAENLTNVVTTFETADTSTAGV